MPLTRVWASGYMGMGATSPDRRGCPVGLAPGRQTGPGARVQSARAPIKEGTQRAMAGGLAPRRLFSRQSPLQAPPLCSGGVAGRRRGQQERRWTPVWRHQPTAALRADDPCPLHSGQVAAAAHPRCPPSRQAFALSASFFWMPQPTPASSLRMLARRMQSTHSRLVPTAKDGSGPPIAGLGVCKPQRGGRPSRRPRRNLPR